MCASQADIKLGQLSWEGGREREGRKGGEREGGGQAEHIAIIWTDCGQASVARARLNVTRGCASSEAAKFTLIYCGSQKGGGAKGWTVTTAAGHFNFHLRHPTDLDPRLPRSDLLLLIMLVACKGDSTKYQSGNEEL